MNKTVKKFIYLVVGMVVLLNKAYAIDQYQIEATFEFTDRELSENVDNTQIIGGINFFFEPVQYKNSPYDQASFLDRHSNALFVLGTNEYDFGVAELDGNLFGIAFEYADQKSPFVASFAILSEEADNSDNEIEQEAIAFNIGYYVQPDVRVSVGLSEAEVEVNGNEIGDASSIKFEYKSVKAKGGDQFLNMEAVFETVDSDDNDSWSLGFEGDYYLDRTLGIGGGLEFNFGDDDEDEGTTILFRFSKFINTQTAIRFSFEQFESDDEVDTDEVSIGFSHRFK